MGELRFLDSRDDEQVSLCKVPRALGMCSPTHAFAFRSLSFGLDRHLLVRWAAAGQRHHHEVQFNISVVCA